MNQAEEIFLGFDPGGSGKEKGSRRKGKFGWSICKVDATGFQEVSSCVGTHAGDVVNAVTGVLNAKGINHLDVKAAGIDAPLFWNRIGNIYRDVDLIIKEAGRKPVSPNGLYGAVVYQGPVLAGLLRQRFKLLQITESFPSAVRQLLVNLPHVQNPPPVLEKKAGETDHQKDARTAAYAAWCMYRQADGWRNLYPHEQHPWLLLDFPVDYWMPIQDDKLRGILQRLKLPVRL